MLNVSVAAWSRYGISNLHPADPPPIFPHVFERSQIAPVENVFRRRAQLALFEIVPSVAGADGHELQHARIAIAVDHAAGATVANQLRLVELVNVAHRRFPEMAA